MAKPIELMAVRSHFRKIEKSYGDLKLHLYAQLKEFVEESGGMDAFDDEARRWINDKYDELLGQK